MFLIPKFLIKVNSKKKIDLLKSYFKGPQTVLDFGCGDLSFSKILKRINPKLSITGVDIVDFGVRPKDISFFCYDGHRLPFKDKSFDTVISFYVYHHCDNIPTVFEECVRVAKKRIIVVESVSRHPIEIPIMKFVDIMYNICKLKPIAFPSAFPSYDYWILLFRKNKLNLRTKKRIVIMPQPSFLPLGESFIFELFR